MSEVTIRDEDRGYHKLVEAVFKFERPTLDVGVLDGSRSYVRSGATVLDVAVWNEFGTQTIPARPFIRTWFDENEHELRAILKNLMRSVIEGKRSKEEILELLGQVAVGQVQEVIANGVDPPNAPSTIARKGSSTPLIDTGVLRSSVTYRVNPG